MSFQQGLSGLNAASKALDVISNNVANSSTVGFKSSSAHFADLYAASLSGSGTSTTAGIGTTISTVATEYTQGNITTTDNTLDLAINGSGFYKVVADDGTVAYTRNGEFSTDTDGYVVNDQGYTLMGYMADANGKIVASTPEAIQLDTSNMAPQATGTTEGVSVELNLDSGADGIDTSTVTFDSTDSSTYTYSTAVTVYDSLGNDHTMTLYFVKDSTATSTWNVYATLDGDSTTSTDLGDLVFTTSGAIDTTSTTLPLTLPTWSVDTGAADLSAAAYWTIDFTGTTSYGGDSTVNTTTQDGYAQGSLSSYSVDEDGVISGNYTNGQTKTLAQVCLTLFANNNGLENIGNNLWVATSSSGQGLDGTPGSGARGAIQSSAVEDSNVDLTTELVDMITMQRNYQANSQSIKTQDEIMQTIVNLR